MQWYARVILTLALLLTSAALPWAQQSAEPPAEDTYWGEPMREVHKRFRGQEGTLAHFGDSITVSLAFWASLQYKREDAPPEMETAFELVSGYMRPECWREWRGPDYGNAGRRTVRWAAEHMDEWLRRLNPEAATIMFGTNDLNSVPFDEYVSTMRAIVQKCLDNGTVVILSTIPPRNRFEEKSATYAEAVRQMARDMRVPLMDFHAEILKRRPDDWNGALEKFAEWQGYDVPTLLARDGVHPSNPNALKAHYSEEALSKCGFSLRNYLALMKYAQVIETLFTQTPNAG
ncbi:MAG: SGNH/GDSL hydrolase family protein [Armatimonadota bacterium]